jgi:hypothetical protein
MKAEKESRERKTRYEELQAVVEKPSDNDSDDDNDDDASDD